MRCAVTAWRRYSVPLSRSCKSRPHPPTAWLWSSRSPSSCSARSAGVGDSPSATRRLRSCHGRTKRQRASAGGLSWASAGETVVSLSVMASSSRRTHRIPFLLMVFASMNHAPGSNRCPIDGRILVICPRSKAPSSRQRAVAAAPPLPRIGLRVVQPFKDSNFPRVRTLLAR
jgi:hypothetical protein